MNKLITRNFPKRLSCILEKIIIYSNVHGYKNNRMKQTEILVKASKNKYNWSLIQNGYYNR